MARYLSVISMFTRGIGILGVLGSLVGLLAALDQRSSSDRLGFSLISLCVLLIAVVVWSTGTFHGTMAKLAPTLVSMHEKFEQARLAQPVAPLPSAEPLPVATEPEPSTEPTPERAPDAEPAPAPRAARAPEPKPEPERAPCPSCGGLVHPDATRCVHCMKRIARG